MKKKKVLITGAGGYVGSALCETLKDDYEVVGFYHFPLSRQVGTSEGRGGAKIINGDICDYKKLSRAAKGAYAIIHAASPTKNSWVEEHPYEALRAIVTGSRNVRRAAEENKVPLLIHFSTQAVYSNFKKRPMPLREDMSLEPDTLYGALKAAAEDELIDMEHETGNMKQKKCPRVVILRPANIYGKGADVLRGNVVHAFAKNAVKGEPLFLTGGGKQKADFVHVRDVARLVSLVLKNPVPKKMVILNAGSGKAVSVKEIARMVVQETKRRGKKPPKIIVEPSPKETIAADRWLSIEKVNRYYGWKPEISFAQGIKELIGHFQNL